MKTAALLPDVQLQPHQQRIADAAARGPLRKLLMWQMGSGKSLGSLAAMEQDDDPYAVVAPASLRPNYQGESEKFTDRDAPPPVHSYQSAAKGELPAVDKLVVDEAQNLRSPHTRQTQAVIDAAEKAKSLLLLSGTPVVNRPGDLAVPLQLLTGKKMSPDEFEARYTGTKPTYPTLLHRLIGRARGSEPVIRRRKELEALLDGHVDYYAPADPVVPVDYEDHAVDMSPEQVQLYRGMLDQLPWHLRKQLRSSVDPSSQDLTKLMAFLSGPRQVGLSTLPFRKDRDPGRAFEQSPKLQLAMAKLQEHLADPRKKGLVFSNFIDAGLTPYAHALTRAGVPHGVFHGGLSDADRKRLVDDYNAGRIRAALIGPSGTEGLSMKGTQLIQQLDPHWHPTRARQAVGRGLRFDSHDDLPEELRRVTVQRFASKLPSGLARRLARATGIADPDVDRYVGDVAERKAQANQQVLDLLRRVGEKRAGTYYHGSPVRDIETLRPGSYVTPRRALAELMGRFHLDTGRPWSDDDLAEPHRTNQDEARFKPGREPAGVPTVYRVELPDDAVESWGDDNEVRTRAPAAAVPVDVLPLLRRVGGKRATSRRAVLVTGNPAFIANNPDADRFYGQIESLLSDAGYETTRDPGEPYTAPEPADLWVGHSRGTDRLRFAPTGVRTVRLGSSHPDAINHPDDTAVSVDGRPSVSHYTLTPEMVTALKRRIAGTGSTVDALLAAKAESDRKNYPAKHAILRRLLRDAPDEFAVDSGEGERMVGVTHRPSGFRVHMPSVALPEGYIRAKASLV